MKTRLSFLIAVVCIAALLLLPASAEGQTGSSVLSFTYGGASCRAGFCYTDANGVVTPYPAGGTTRPATGAPEPDAPWTFFCNLSVDAFKCGEDGAYTCADELSVTVTGMTIETLTGEEDIFSFSEEGGVQIVEGAATQLWYQLNHAANILVWADVSVSGPDGVELAAGRVSLRVIAPAYEPPEFALYTAESGGELLENDMGVCYSELQGGVWLLPKEGFDEHDRDILSAWGASGELIIDWNNDFSAAWIALPEPTSDSGYSLSLSCNLQRYELRVLRLPDSKAAHIWLNGEDCAVGFYDGTRSIFDNYAFSRFNSDGMDSPDTPYSKLTDLRFAAGVLVISETVYGHRLVEGVDITVNSMEIVTILGPEDAFSFSETQAVSRCDGAAEALYFRGGESAAARVKADIVIEVEGQEPVTATVSLGLSVKVSGLRLYTSEGLSAASRVSENSTVAYYSLEDGCLWLRTEDGFAENFSVNCDAGAASVERLDGNTAKIKLPAPGANMGTCGLNITNGEESMFVSIKFLPSGSCMRIENGSNEYIVGFAFDGGEDGVTIISEGNWIYGDTTTEDANPDNPRRQFREMAVKVGLRKVDAEGNPYYELDNTGPVSVSVLSMQVQHLYGVCEGYNETFSFAEDGAQVTGVTSPASNSANIYIKRGYDAVALVTAEVEVTVGGSTRTGSVSVALHVNRGIQQTFTRPADDTVEELNAALEEIAQGLPEGGTGYVYVSLTAEKYEGTIVIPEEFLTRGGYELTLMSITHEDRTTIAGGIDLNGSGASVRELDFIAPDSGTETRAIWNGCSTTVQNCSFQGYDVAIDASVNTINPRYCVFVGNTVAARIDLPEVTSHSSRNDWYNNVFINNDTAVQVLRLNSFVSPYYFRVTASNFVGNDVAFDVRCEDTVYFYRNYYGEVKNNAPDMTASEILEALRAGGSEYIQKQPPVVSIADHSVTKVVTNPRWNAPAELDAGVPDLPAAAVQTRSARLAGTSSLPAAQAQPSENYLTADWELPTEIINGEEGLTLDAAAFAEGTTGDRVISVVDESGKVLGVWNFGSEALTGLGGRFDAQLFLTQNEDGSLDIGINDASGLLSKLRPRLTIPGVSGDVTHEGGAVASESSGGGLSFTVSGGGSYEITGGAQLEVSAPSGGKVTVRFTPGRAGEYVAASYAQDGRMLECQVVDAASAGSAVTLEFSAQSAYEIRLFSLDSGHAPQSSAASAAIPAA